MSQACSREAEVVRAAATDRWSDALRAHLGTCEHCVAAASAAPWMDRFAKMSDREHILPDPSLLYLKAQLLKGTVDASRAARPLNLVQIAAYFLIAGSWAALLTWKWPAVQAWLSRFTPSGLVQSAARAESLSLPFLAVIFVLASMTVMLAIHTILAED